MSIPMRRIAAALLAAIVLSMAACGGGSPSTGTAAPPAASPAPAATEPAKATPAETKPVPTIESGPGSSAITSEVKPPNGGTPLHLFRCKDGSTRGSNGPQPETWCDGHGGVDKQVQ